MKNYLLAALAAITLCLSACEKDDPKPIKTNGPNKVQKGDIPPAELKGKWFYGENSAGSYWGEDGVYSGPGTQQAMTIDIKEDGTFGLYVLNAFRSGGCGTAYFVSLYGPLKVSAAEKTFDLLPTQGTYQTSYECDHNRNSTRPSTPDEIARQQDNHYRYELAESPDGQPRLRIFFGDEDVEGAEFKPAQ